jgi:UDP-glucose 4-epimerase
MVSKRKLLITGSTGFIGKKMTDAFQIFGYEVLKAPQSLDLNDADKTIEFITSSDPHFILHLATDRSQDRESSSKESSNSLSRLDQNVVGASQKLKHLKRFVAIGSCDEYGIQSFPYLESSVAQPISVYGVLKLAFSKHLVELSLNSGFPSVILRPSVVYGPNQSPNMLIPSVFAAIIEKRRMALSPGNQTRDFVHVDDVVEALISCITTESILPGSIYNLASQESLTIKEVANKIADLYGPKYRMLLEFGALNYRHSEVMNYRVNAEKARKELGWKSKVTLDEGIRHLKDTLDYGV